MENSEYSIFQQIAGELEGNRIDKALWTKAFCDADGNASLTRARYIKLRAAVLDTTGAENLPSTLATVATVDSILSPTDCEAQESALINYEKDWPDIASVEHLRSLVEAKIYKRSLINALALELNQIDLDLSPTDLGADAVALMTKFCKEWPYVSESLDLLRNEERRFYISEIIRRCQSYPLLPFRNEYPFGHHLTDGASEIVWTYAEDYPDIFFFLSQRRSMDRIKLAKELASEIEGILINSAKAVDEASRQWLQSFYDEEPNEEADDETRLTSEDTGNQVGFEAEEKDCHGLFPTAAKMAFKQLRKYKSLEDLPDDIANTTANILYFENLYSYKPHLFPTDSLEALKHSTGATHLWKFIDALDDVRRNASYMAPVGYKTFRQLHESPNHIPNLYSTLKRWYLD